MRLKSSKQAEIAHRNNMKMIQSLIAKFKDPDTPPEERAKIKEKFQKIIDFVDKSQPTDSMFLKLIGRMSSNGNGQH